MLINDGSTAAPHHKSPNAAISLENKSCAWTIFRDKYKSSEIIESNRDAQKFFPSSVAKNILRVF
jgi:hypothetical protein